MCMLCAMLSCAALFGVFIMVSMIVFGSLVTSLALISIIAKASPVLLKRMLGYEVYVDISISLLIGLACGISGTMSGFVIGAFTGLIFGVTLFVLARTIGYSRLIDGVWVDFPPVWTFNSLFGRFHSEKMGELA